MRSACIPRRATDELALIEPHFNTRGAQRLADPPRRLRVLGRVAEEDRVAGFQAHGFGSLSNA